MADITPDFNLCLQAKGAQPVVKKDFNLDKINSFLHEAYSIVRTHNPTNHRQRR